MSPYLVRYIYAIVIFRSPYIWSFIHDVKLPASRHPPGSAAINCLKNYFAVTWMRLHAGILVMREQLSYV